MFFFFAGSSGVDVAVDMEAMLGSLGSAGDAAREKLKSMPGLEHMMNMANMGPPAAAKEAPPELWMRREVRDRGWSCSEVVGKPGG